MGTFEKEDVAKVIGNFTERCCKSQVRWPEWVFEIQRASEVKIDKDSLKDPKRNGELWTFEGTAVIHKTDARNTVPTKSNCKIVGSAAVAFNRNDWNKNELLPEIENVTITKIEEL